MVLTDEMVEAGVAALMDLPTDTLASDFVVRKIYLAMREKENEWQPIETAPRDGREARGQNLRSNK